MAGKPKAQVEVTAKDNTKAGLSSVERSVKGMANNVSTAMKAAFAGAIAGALGSLFKSAIKESQDSARNMLMVGNALDNIGLKADALTPQLGALFTQLSNQTGIDDDDIAKAFTNLVRRTGDYNEALKLLPKSLDVAVARQMDFEAASEAVVKASEGNSKALKLVANTQGAADDAGKTFIGTLGRMKAGWGNLLQAVGDAITGNEKMAGSSNFLVDTLVNAERWVRENEASIQGFVNAIGTLGQALFKVAGFITSVFLRAFQGVQTIAVDLALSFAQTGPTLKLALGEGLLALGWFMEKANSILNAVGIHIADGLVGTVTQSGTRMVAEARTHLAELEKVRDEQYAEIFGTNRRTEKATPVAKAIAGFSGTGKPDDGKTDKKKKDEKDAVLEEVKAQEKLLDIADKRAAAWEKLRAIALEQKAISEDTSKTDAERTKAVERMQAAMKAGGFVEDSTLGTGNVSASNTAAPSASSQSPGEAFMAAAGLVTPLDELTKGAIDSIGELDTALADLAGGSVRSLGEAFSQAFEAAIDGSATLGGALIGAAKAAVGAEAQARGRLSFAKAAEALAAGFFGNPAAFAAAAKYAAAGTAYYGLAAAMGKGGGSGGHAGGGAGGGAVSDRGLRDSRTSNLGKGDAQIIIQGGLLDMTDPRQKTALSDALSDLTGRRVTITGK